MRSSDGWLKGTSGRKIGSIHQNEGAEMACKKWDSSVCEGGGDHLFPRTLRASAAVILQRSLPALGTLVRARPVRFTQEPSRSAFAQRKALIPFFLCKTDLFPANAADAADASGTSPNPISHFTLNQVCQELTITVDASHLGTSKSLISPWTQSNVQDSCEQLANAKATNGETGKAGISVIHGRYLLRAFLRM